MAPTSKADRPHAFRNRLRSSTEEPPHSPQPTQGEPPPEQQQAPSGSSEIDVEGLAALRDILMENWETYAALAATGFLLAKGKGPALRLAAKRWGRAAFQMIAQMTTDQLEARWNRRGPASSEGQSREGQSRERQSRAQAASRGPRA